MLVKRGRVGAAVMLLVSCGPSSETDTPGNVTSTAGTATSTTTATATATTTTTMTSTATATTTATETSPGPASKCAGAPPGEGFKCVQDCGPPVVRSGDPEPGWRWLSPADQEKREQFGCPKCLPPSTMIDTPSGPLPLESLREGDLVWSKDAAGRRVAEPIAHLVRVPARRHFVLRAKLADGRQVLASGQHPLASGAALSTIEVGAIIDGSRVLELGREPLGGEYTMDLLPAGATGLYWAGGVLMGTTLSERSSTDR